MTGQSKSLDFCNSTTALRGDLNLALNPQVDKNGKINLPKKSVFTLLKLMQAFRLLDIWRTLHSDVTDYTFYSSRHQTFSRIDLFLISQDIVESVTQCLIHPKVPSDLSSIQTDFELQSAQVHFKQWRVNNSLFEDPKTKKQISEYIHALTKTPLTIFQL